MFYTAVLIRDLLSGTVLTHTLSYSTEILQRIGQVQILACDEWSQQRLVPLFSPVSSEIICMNVCPSWGYITARDPDPGCLTPQMPLSIVTVASKWLVTGGSLCHPIDAHGVLMGFYGS